MHNVCGQVDGSHAEITLVKMTHADAPHLQTRVDAHHALTTRANNVSNTTAVHRRTTIEEDKTTIWGYTLTITWSLVARTVNNPQKTSGVTIAIQHLGDMTV